MIRQTMSGMKTVALCVSIYVSGMSSCASPYILAPPERLEPKHISTIMAGALQFHIREDSITPAIAEATLSNFVETLDYGRVFLLEDDVEYILSHTATFNHSYTQHRWDFVTNVYARFLARVDAQHAHAMAYLSQTNLVLDETREVHVDRESRAYPQTQAEALRALEDSLQYQLAYLISIEEPMTGAVEKVRNRRIRLKRHFHERDTSEQFALFLGAFTQALDPHSAYFSKEDMEDFEISMNLSLEGIGALLGQTEGITEIKSLTPGGPAERSGLVEPGDKIIAVAQKGEEFVDIIDMALKDVVRHIRGKKGTEVTLRIVRRTPDGTVRKTVTITREEVSLEDQAARLEIFPISVTNAAGESVEFRIGVIDLPSFYYDARRAGLFGGVRRSSAHDVKQLLHVCATSDVHGVVLTLHRNGGGMLDEAVAIAGLFMKEANIVYADYRHGRGDLLATRDAEMVYGGPLVVTVSRITASGAEIVAGALQDYHRAVIVGGDHTYGKGSVQRVIPLSDTLGALKITIGEYFLASGRSPQKWGIEPDIHIPSELEAIDIGEQYQQYALPTRTVDSHISPDEKTGRGVAWQPLTDTAINTLRTQSATRTADDPAIAQIYTNIAQITEQRARQTITIGEVLEQMQTNMAERITEEMHEQTQSLTNDVLVREAIAIVGDMLSEGFALISCPREELEEMYHIDTEGDVEDTETDDNDGEETDEHTEQDAAEMCPSAASLYVQQRAPWERSMKFPAD